LNRSHEQRPGSNKGFFVCEQNTFTRLSRSKCRWEPCCANDRSHHNLTLIIACRLSQSLWTDS
jgi:hypothetical protein